MNSIFMGYEGQKVIFFGQRFHLVGTIDRVFHDETGVAIAEFGDDAEEWDGDSGSGPSNSWKVGSIRVPSTAVGLGVQLAKSRWPNRA